MANFTKQAIKASFMKLLNERPLNKISVRDIVEDCGINRNSFYYHFQDIPSLLTEIITEHTEQMIREYPSINSLDECFHVAFQFAKENSRAVMHIYHSVNRDLFETNTLKLCQSVVETYIATAFPDNTWTRATGPCWCAFSSASCLACASTGSAMACGTRPLPTCGG